MGVSRECFTEIFTSGTVVRAVSNEQKRRRLYWKLRKDRRSNERVSENSFGFCKASFSTSKENRIVVICADGSYHKLEFDPVKGGSMSSVNYGRFG